jgi:hypothetical protein
VNILALLGEDTTLQALLYHTVSTLNLPVCTRVSHRGPVHVDVIVVTEVHVDVIVVSSELSVIVGNHGIGYPKTENDVLDKIYGMIRADFGQGFHLDPFSKLIHHDE